MGHNRASICGALPQAPYGLEAPLSDAEQAEAEALLQAERRPGDELLDGLPWSWSWIRLPWMDDLLQVVW
jgi:hypothetical protein